MNDLLVPSVVSVLLLAPALMAVWVVATVRRERQRPWRRVSIAGALAASVVAGGVAGISFLDSRLNVAILAVAYAAWCLGALSLLTWPRLSLPFSFGLVLSTSIPLGYAAATVGWLGLASFLVESASEINGDLGKRHRFVVTRFGNVYSDDAGRGVAIYRRLTIVPLLERRVYSARFSGSEYDVEDLRVNEEVRRGGDLIAVVRASTKTAATVQLRE